MKEKQSIAYLGFNSFKAHKRGVENVIDFQSKTTLFNYTYYICWGTKQTKVSREGSFISIEIQKSWYWPLLLNIILFKLKKKRKVMLHGHNYLMSLCSVYRIDIFTVHDGLFYLKKSTKSKRLFLFGLIEKIVYNRSKFIHFISKYSKSQSLFKSNRPYKIISNTSHFEHLVPENVLEVDTENSEYTKVLIVRSIEERARLDLILNLAEELNNYEFTIAGKGPLLAEFLKEKEERNLTNVNFLGYVSDEDLLSLYKNCKVVMVPAAYGEGFGLPIIEGYLFNKPVIASNVCAIPEVIISNNFLFDNNVEDMKSCLYGVDTSLNFRDYYNINYSNINIVNQFKELYKSLIN